MNFHFYFPSIPSDNSRDHYVLKIKFTSMQDASENDHYCPELCREALRLKLNFTFLLVHFTELIVLVEWMSSVAVDIFDVAGDNIHNG